MGEGARLYCPNPKCSQLLVADDKRAGGCGQPLLCCAGRLSHSGRCWCTLALLGPLRDKATSATKVRKHLEILQTLTLKRASPTPRSVRVLPSDTPIDCPYCKHQLCANCSVAWHAGMTCQQYQVGGPPAAPAAAREASPCTGPVHASPPVTSLLARSLCLPRWTRLRQPALPVHPAACAQ